MNNRYIFRGKTEISERWVVGDLVQWSGDDMCICEEYNSTEKKNNTQLSPKQSGNTQD